MTEPHRGHCFCKAIRFEVDAPLLSVVNCHCESCRRQCSAPMTTYIGVADGQWRWTQGEPKIYRSSPGVERTFCDNCGTPMSFRSNAMSGFMHVYVAAMEEPDCFQPKLHVAIEEKLDWLDLADDLPKRKGPEYL